MSEAPGPFSQWVENAQPEIRLWQTVVGVLAVAGAWMAWTFAVLFAALGAGLVSSEAFEAVFGLSQAQIDLTRDRVIVVMLIGLASIWGMGFGVWGVVKFFHRRPFMSLVAWNRRFSFGQFGIGCLIAAGYLAISLGVSGYVLKESAASEIVLLELNPPTTIMASSGSSSSAVTASWRSCVAEQIVSKVRKFVARYSSPKARA